MRRSLDELASMEREVVAVSELRSAAVSYLMAHGWPSDVAREAVIGTESELMERVIGALDGYLEEQFDL
jgi:hypothetical protein